MPPAGPAPPRLSRETRLLLITALVSLLAIWALARLRFPDRPVSPNLLPPLTQFAPRSPIEEIPALVADLTQRLSSSLVPIAVEDATTGVRPVIPMARAGLRVDEEVAVVLLEDVVRAVAGVEVVARDRITGLALARVRPQSVASLATWLPRRPDLPRYLLAVEVADEMVFLRPVFVGPLVAVPSEVWRETIWLLPARTDMVPGEFAFTPDGALAGLIVDLDGRSAIVPGHGVVAMAERLMHDPPGPPAHLGIRVQPMTEAVAVATGAAYGVVVTYVEPDGPAASHLGVADVIEAADDTPVASFDVWRARIARLAPGDAIALRTRRVGSVEDIQLVAVAGDARAYSLEHGLTMRTMNGIGVEVIRVTPGSSAARAGLEPGDVITYFDGLRAPAAAQVTRAFDAAPEDRPLLVAVTRGGEHHVVTMKRGR